jgi:hypothetical protein
MLGKGVAMHYWMIRAGEGGKYFDEFIKNDIVAIGWHNINDLSKVTSKSQLETIYKKNYPKESNVTKSMNSGQLWAFRKELEKGDIVLTPNPLTRTIYIGRIKSDYLYGPKKMFYRHIRKANWEKEVSRDIFSQDMRNSMGALQTIIRLDRHADEIDNTLSGKTSGISAKGRIRFPKKPKEEVAIGEPLDFEGLTNAPMEENGVIFLFGKLHERMGIRIKAIRKGFPDAAAEVWIKDRLYPRMIEFEYRSSDFKRHRHDPSKCDIIVCWEHDWRDCPRNIFVIELRKEIANYIQE